MSRYHVVIMGREAPELLTREGYASKGEARRAWSTASRAAPSSRADGRSARPSRTRADGSEGAVRELMWRSVLLVACALCGYLHAIDWSPWCAVCWGGLCGEVPGDRADDGEVCDGC